MKILITGGAGFIGSHLVEYFINHKDHVVVLDDLSTGSMSNINKYLDHDRFTFVEGSILDKGLVQKLVYDVDHVIHMAAVVGIFKIMEDPISSFKINLDGTHNILEACKNANVPVLIASTSETYGKNYSDAISEDADRTYGPAYKSRWSYAESKALDEMFAQEYHRRYGLEVRIVRLFNTVGPRQVGRYGMVVPRFIEAAINNKPIPVFGNGMQTRCFSHISDVVRGIIAILNSEEAVADPVNIGNNEEMSILELANLVVKKLGSSSTIEMIPYSVAYKDGYEDMMRRVPDISKAYRLTGWKPEKNIHDIINDISRQF